jgi:dihydroneopterin aldolase
MVKKNLDIIRIHKAQFYAYHGVLTDEQNLGGRFEVDVDLYCDLSKSGKTDRLEDTVNYERVYDAIRQIITGKKFFLLEALGRKIADGILKDFRKVQTITIRVRKPGAPVKGVIDHVEVEMTINRSRR